MILQSIANDTLLQDTSKLQNFEVCVRRKSWRRYSNNAIDPKSVINIKLKNDKISY